MSVELLKDAIDYGDGPDFIATGIRRMYMISPSIVRITFVRTDVRRDGVEEQRVNGFMTCDISQLSVITASIDQGLATLLEQPRDAATPEGTVRRIHRNDRRRDRSNGRPPAKPKARAK
jgi:hypothetical protein